MEVESADTYFWSPPPIGCVKINFDVAFFPTSNDVSVGIIIRREYGHFLYALTEPSISFDPTLVAECLTARVGPFL